MTISLKTFDQCLSIAKTSGKMHLLLGNGFSRACRNDIFSYAALFDRADFAGLSPHCRNAFDALGTTDFEVVIKALNSAATIVESYSPTSTALAKTLREDSVKLREVLVSAIAGSHPDWPGEIDPDAYHACKCFLENFEHIYTLNYDLLLYWAFMQDEIEPILDCDDGFRHPDTGPEEYVTWEVENSFNQKIYYLHGALHLFDAGSELQKYTWKNTGIRLKDQIRSALAASKYPLFVSEGTSQEKLQRIKHSGYLHRGLASMPKVTGSMFVYGLSFAQNDEHILRILEIGKIKNIFVGVYGDPSAQHNAEMIVRAQKIPKSRAARFRGKRPAQELEIQFYDAESARVWG